MKKLQLTFVLGLLMSFVSFAQSDRERNFPDLPKNNDAVSQYESPDDSNMEYKQESTQKTNLNPVKDTKSTTTNSLKKDSLLYKQGGEKDSKKEEISTLSFNLFLYIVDRFKED